MPGKQAKVVSPPMLGRMSALRERPPAPGGRDRPPCTRAARARRPRRRDGVAHLKANTVNWFAMPNRALRPRWAACRTSALEGASSNSRPLSRSSLTGRSRPFSDSRAKRAQDGGGSRSEVVGPCAPRGNAQASDNSHKFAAAASKLGSHLTIINEMKGTSTCYGKRSSSWRRLSLCPQASPPMLSLAAAAAAAAAVAAVAAAK